MMGQMRILRWLMLGGGIVLLVSNLAAASPSNLITGTGFYLPPGNRVPLGLGVAITVLALLAKPKGEPF